MLNNSAIFHIVQRGYIGDELKKAVDFFFILNAYR
jgi:hypothetical protein